MKKIQFSWLSFSCHDICFKEARRIGVFLGENGAGRIRTHFVSNFEQLAVVSVDPQDDADVNKHHSL